MTAYQLLGGNRNNPVLLPERVASPYTPGSRINMFSYKGPRRAKVSYASTCGAEHVEHLHVEAQLSSTC